MISSMFNRAVAAVVAVVLSFALAADDAAAQASNKSSPTAQGGRIKNQINSTAPGTYIAIRFTDGRRARGYLANIEPGGFSFRVGDRTSGAETRTTFDAVQSVKVVRPTHTPAAAWIATGVITGVVVAAVVVYLIFRHNEGH